jgi:myo-inositol catabolism protein IolC
MMLEKKPEAALFGLPGRTQIVGRRIEMPSSRPLRV